MLAYLFRKRSAAALVDWGIALLVVQLRDHGGFGSIAFFMTQAAAAAPGASAEAIRHLADDEPRDSRRSPAAELRREPRALSRPL